LAAAHGLFKDLDGEHDVDVVFEDVEASDFNDVRAGEAPPTVVEERLPLLVEQHLHGP
jgi:hypothetical protein